MEARSERRSLRRRGHRRDDHRPTRRTPHGQTPMTLDEGLDRGKLDLVVFADDLGRQIAGQRHPATRAFIGMMIDDLVDVLAQATRMSLVARLGAARLGLLPALFPIDRGRL